MTNIFLHEDFKITPSKYKTKKYDVYLNEKYILSFGAIKLTGEPYSQYFDKFGYYTKYNHMDEARKLRYYKRHGEASKKYSAKWWSHEFLW